MPEPPSNTYSTIPASPRAAQRRADRRVVGAQQLGGGRLKDGARRCREPTRRVSVHVGDGGIVAPMVASEQRDVAFLILLAAPGVPLADILQTQAILIARAEGVPEDIIQRDSSFNAQVFSVIRGQAEEAAQDEALMSILELAFAALS